MVEEVVEVSLVDHRLVFDAGPCRAARPSSMGAKFTMPDWKFLLLNVMTS